MTHEEIVVGIRVIVKQNAEIEYLKTEVELLKK